MIKKICVSDLNLSGGFGGEQLVAYYLYKNLKNSYYTLPLMIYKNENFLNLPFTKIGNLFYKRNMFESLHLDGIIRRYPSFSKIISKILIKKQKPVEVLISNSRADILLLNRLKFENLIIIKHNVIKDKKHWRYYLNFLNKITSNSKDFRIVALNTDDFIRLNKIYPNKVKLIYNGIPIKRKVNNVTEYTNKKKIIFYLGRLDETQKRVSLLIKSARYIKNNKFIILIAGKGRDTEYYKDLVKAYNLEKKIKFLSFISEAQKSKFLKISDVFVQPSFKESFSMITLEAMSKQAIVLTTKNSGSKDLIKNGINGFFIEPNPKKIAQVIDNILSLPKNKKIKIKINAFESAKKFDIKFMIKKYKELIDSFSE